MSNNGWETVKLGDVASIKHGWPFKSECFSLEKQGKPIVVNIGNFRYEGGFRFEATQTKEYLGDYPKEYELAPDDILLIMTCQTEGGEILGIPGKIPDDHKTYLHNQRMGKVIIKEPKKVYTDFLYWVFLWYRFNQELVASSTGTKILHTAPKRIEAFEFNLPSFDEQEAIARVLCALGDKIELNRQMNITFEQLAQVLFKSWFVDFDPVVAKAAGKKPIAMSDDVAALFPDKFVDSEMGPIPDAFKVDTIGKVLKMVGGGTPSTKDPTYWEGGNICWATPRDLANLNDPILTDIAKKITEKGLRKISSGLLPKNTVLFSSRAPIGYITIIDTPAAINQGFIAFLPVKDISYCFVKHWLSENIEEIKSRANGTTFLEISKRSFRPIPICLPDKSTMNCFHSYADHYYQLIKSNIYETQILVDLRDSLLPKLLSGQIRLKQAEKLVSEAI